jgi:hypothetical protein
MKSSSNHPKRARGSSLASHKSLEARHVPNSHQEEKKDDRNSPDFALPLYNAHSHNAEEQDLIIRGVAEKLAASNSQKNYNPAAAKENTQYFQAQTQTPGSDNPLENPPALNRADSRSMLSSLTSPSFVDGLYTRNELLSARQKALAAALDNELAEEPKRGPLCCGIGV